MSSDDETRTGGPTSSRAFLTGIQIDGNDMVVPPGTGVLWRLQPAGGN